MGHDSFVHKSPQFTNTFQFSVARSKYGLNSMRVSIPRHIIFMIHDSTNYDIVTNAPEAKCLLLFETHIYIKILSLSARACQRFVYFWDG
jgi:hypothetical protein